MNADEIKAAMKEGRTAYREAMSDFQERFYQELGKYYDLGRFGPRRERRSRSEQVEYEALVEKGIEASREIKIEAKEKAENEADEIIRKAKKEADKINTEAKGILQTAKNQADKIKESAEADAKKTKDDAWHVAQTITDASKKEAASILNKAKGFINLLLDKVSKLQGGESLVKWAKTYIISVNKPKAQGSNTHHNKQKNSR